MWSRATVGFAAASLLLVSCAESIHQRQRLGYEPGEGGSSATTVELSQYSGGMTAAENDGPLAAKLDLQQGQAVTLSGTVLRAKRLKGMTEIEVLHAPIRPDGRPAEDRRLSQGRFLARQTTFLDPAILTPGPMITVRGMVEGEIVRPLEPGADDYAYPLDRHTGIDDLAGRIAAIRIRTPPAAAAAVSPPSTMLDLTASFLAGFVRGLLSSGNDAWSSSSSGSSAPASRPSPPPERIPRQFQKGR